MAPDGAVDVADRQLDPHRLAVLDRRLGGRDQLVIERRVQPVVLRLAMVDRDAGFGAPALVEDARRGRRPWPSSDRARVRMSSRSTRPIISFTRA